MARVARPWYLKKTDWWYVWHIGQRTKLVKGRANRKAAKDRLKHLGVDMPSAVCNSISAVRGQAANKLYWLQWYCVTRDHLKTLSRKAERSCPGVDRCKFRCNVFRML